MRDAKSGTLLGGILNIFFPYTCILCGRSATHELLCWRCLPPLPGIGQKRCSACFEPVLAPDSAERCNLCQMFPLPFRQTRYIWEYQGKIKELVSIMKYRPSAALVSLLARSIAESTITLFSEHSWDSITAVPSSKESFLERGFNPALQIAKHIKLKLKHTRLEPNLLQHRGSAAQQASLASSKRIENVRNSFAANANKVHGREILLVDDVVTTGATSTACALALLDAGAAQVDLFSLCRSGAWREQRHEIYQRFKGSASLAC